MKFIIIVSSVIALCSSQIDGAEQIQYFLPNTSVPNHYDLLIGLNLGPEFGFTGRVNINITVLKAIQNIVLHSTSVEITRTKLRSQSTGQQIEITAVKRNWENGFLNVSLGELIKTGDYVLGFEFVGNYFNYPSGLFLSRYYETETSKEQKFVVATQFEPILARTMFPCYDEPNLKATFQLTVSYPRGYHAISNTPTLKKGYGKLVNRTREVFETTPRMSTYLLAFAVSEFESNKLVVSNRTDIFLYVPKNQKNLTELAMNVSAGSVQYFQELFRCNYSLAKLDGIAVPTFAGGMENWGLIVYDPSVVFDHNTSMENEYSWRGVINLLCHEIAHQWFGNLVTLDWWDYVWLNEGFATYYAQRMGDYLFNATSGRYLRFMDYHVVELQYMLQVDMLDKTESLNTHVERPEDIRPKFNFYGYNKGSAIVRFMSLIFNDFDLGITEYLHRKGFHNSKPADLFDALNRNGSAVVGRVATVSEIMNSWVNQPGFPLVTLSLMKINDQWIINATQEHFSFMGNGNESAKWWIPVSVTSGNAINFDPQNILGWLSDQNKSVAFEVTEEFADSWFVGNLQAAIFCQVNYDLKNWQKLIAFLKSENYHDIHYLNRARLVHDVYLLARAKRLPESLAFDLLSYLEHEDDILVQTAANNIFIQYSDLLQDTEIYPKYKKFVSTIYGINKTAEMFKAPDWQSLVHEAFNVIDNKHSSSLEVFSKIANRIYKQTDLNQVKRAAITRDRNYQMSQMRLEFVEKLSESLELNTLIKSNFFMSHTGNYEEIKNWLNSKY